MGGDEDRLLLDCLAAEWPDSVPSPTRPESAPEGEPPTVH